MKRKILAMLLVGVMAFSLAGCNKGKKNEKETPSGVENQTTEEETKALYEIGGKNFYDVPDYSEYVELGEYTGNNITVTEPDDVEQTIKDYIKMLCENKATYDQIKNRKVEKGDMINIDFKGEVDGKELENGSATGQMYTVGTTWIESLDKQLVGLEVDKEYKLDCKFPDTYPSNPDIAGKDAVFTVKVNYICGEKNVPSWTDEFVSVVTGGQFTTTADFEAELKTEVEDENKTTIENSFATGIWSTVIANSKIKGYPAEKLETSVEEYFKKFQEQYKEYAKNYDMTYEELLSECGYKNGEEDLKKACEDKAKKELDYIMTACVIADKEKLAITEDIYNSVASDLCQQQQIESIEKLEETYGREYIVESLVFEAVSQWLMGQNKMTLTKEPVTTEAETTTEDKDTETTTAN